MPKATATGLDANVRSFNAVSESHQFFSIIAFKSEVMNENSRTKNYDQGSMFRKFQVFLCLFTLFCLSTPTSISRAWILGFKT